MHRWSPTDDLQLALLTRISEGAEPAMPDIPELALAARALKERGHVTMPTKDGRWRTEITEIGRFYLRRGHHPDRPDPAPPKIPPTTAPCPSPADIGRVLTIEGQQAGRFLRVPNPNETERARYRRAFGAAHQPAPAGTA
ncbi:hypothetical protein AB0L67_28390 [Streptomyces flaveolus]|jgi:hypothetical protein|uniref:hypothetical protein n=1 Tax=Streptomyces flaveolus TaxID=67297 RepID=UPI0034333018